MADRDSQTEWEREVADLLDAGQTFLAQDLAEQGLSDFPDSDRLRILRAGALTRTGALADALSTLEPLLARFVIDDAPYKRAATALDKLIDGRGGKRATKNVAELAEALDELRGKRQLVQSLDADSLELLGRVYDEAWAQSGGREHLELASAMHRAAFERTGRLRPGIGAAVASWQLRRRSEARKLAEAVLAQHAELADMSDAVQRFWNTGMAGAAHLMLNQPTRAQDMYAQAITDVNIGADAVVPLLRQVRQLEAAGVKLPVGLLETLKPPRVVVFTGHPLDRPDQRPARFPAALEAALRAEIDERLERMDARVGYSSAACGSDLLFVEAMLDRGGEVNVILPFDQEDYIAASVRYAGPRWEMRFRNALKLANSVTYATTEHYLGHDNLFRFANQMLHGMATMRARFLETEPHLLAVWDMDEGSLPGGAADFIDQWADIMRLSIIDLDDVLTRVAPKPAPKAAAAAADTLAKTGRERHIRGILFADLVGFSKLGEERIPAYMDFLARLKDELAKGIEPPMINTWGDAIVAVMPKAVDLVDYALRLKASVPALSGPEHGFAQPMNVRISLHAGPVFEGNDPFHSRLNYYGAHINRAARLEPVTVPGHVYATQQFVALLTSEESALRNEAEAAGQDWRSPVVAEYVGVLELAKNFGDQPVYHIRDAD
ncbi:MAG: adenylate/guanylate cyclase domain-containing protein [Alphaproteobacteria bacterium]